MIYGYQYSFLDLTSYGSLFRLEVAEDVKYTDSQQQIQLKDLAFVTTGHNKKALIIDITDISAPTIIKEIDLSDAAGSITNVLYNKEHKLLFIIAGGKLYVYELKSLLDSNLQGEPRRIGVYENDNLLYAGSITADDKYLYVGSDRLVVIQYDPDLLVVKVTQPPADEKGENKIFIKNSTNPGDPQMQEITAEAVIKDASGKPRTLTQDQINQLELCWNVKVEYKVKTPKSPHREWMGLLPSGAGLGADGFLIPGPTEDDCKIIKGKLTFTIDNTDSSDVRWRDTNGKDLFGGGKLEITAKTTIDGKEQKDTYFGKIEGQAFDDSFKKNITDYLMAPIDAVGYQSILTDVAETRFFRIIAYKESAYRHFYPSIHGDPVGAIYPRENEGGDGGFGVMQLTKYKTLPILIIGDDGYEHVPRFEQIWHYKKNIDAGVEILAGRLDEAKSYPAKIRTTSCTTPPQGSTYYCFPVQKKAPDATDFSAYQLRMDTYSLWNSNWHYWKWVGRKKGGWQPRIPQGEACKDPDKPNGSCYADKAEAIEKQLQNNTPPSGW